MFEISYPADQHAIQESIAQGFANVNAANYGCKCECSKLWIMLLVPLMAYSDG